MGDILKRTLSDGRVAFYARYIEHDGRRVARATKAQTEEAAIEVLHAIEARVRRGEVGIVKWTKELRAKQKQDAARAAITLADLAEKFCDEYTSPKLKDPERYRRDARSLLRKRVLPLLGARQAQSIKPADVETMRDSLATHGAAPASVVYTLAQLSKVYTWAQKKGIVTCDNPVKGVERPAVQSSIDYLSHDEVGKLLAHAEKHAPDVYPIIATALYSGARKGELYGMLWRHVHLSKRRVDIERSYRETPKSGKRRHVPMHPELEIILRKWQGACPATSDGLVFPLNRRMGRREDMLGLPELLGAAGCHAPEKPWHALRHTFASHFMMAGGNILTLQKLLGHSDLSMTMVYAHLAPDFMAAEVARMSFAPKVAEMADLTEERRKRVMDTERETWQDQADKAACVSTKDAQDQRENSETVKVYAGKQGV